MKKVLFIDEVHESLWNGLTELGFECIDGTSLRLDEAKIAAQNAYGIVIRSRFTMNEDFLSTANELAFIARSGAGMENIDVQYCQINNIELFNAPEGNRQAVAEHALGMLLALFNKLIQGNAQVRNGVWDREGNRGVELSGKTVGIIGYGNNGSSFARVLSGLGCEVLAYDKYKKGFGNEYVNESSLDRIKEEADILSFHVPQTEETLYYFNSSFLEEFKKPIYLINLSRGKIVEIKALNEGIKNKKVLGACLDVLEYEKKSFANFIGNENQIPGDLKTLMTFDNVIFSPHVGGWTVESYKKLSDTLLTKIKHWLEN